jgi:hypothetical protein
MWVEDKADIDLWLNEHEGQIVAKCVKKVVKEKLVNEIIDYDALFHPADAKDYGSYLTGAGFQLVDSGNINSPHVGDVVVFQPVPGGSNAGHIEIFAGSNWVSDFIQQTPWPYATHGAYAVYRFPGT